jgi:hypothetical protein
MTVRAFSHSPLSGGGAAADGAPRRVVTGAGDVMDQQREKSLTMDDLYGEGKAYPEPYNAGARAHCALHIAVLSFPSCC